MNRQSVLDQVYAALVEIRVQHPLGLRAIGSANAAAVLSRFGVSSQVAQMCEIIFESLEPGPINPAGLIDFLKDELNEDGSLKKPFSFNCSYPACGEVDENGFHTHPDRFFTALNHNARRYAIEADASGTPGGGLAYYQDWRDEDELREAAGLGIKSAWDAQENRFLTPEEIYERFDPKN